MIGQALKKEEREENQRVSQQPIFVPVLVDVEELKRLEDKLENGIRNHYRDNTQNVFYQKGGKLGRKTLVGFIKSGHGALGIRGLNSLMKEKEYIIRLEGLQVLEAYIEILTDRTGEFEFINNLNAISDEMVSTKREFIEKMVEYHSLSY